MLTKEIKKGDRIQLRNGWYATMMDNGRGVTRMAEVEGYYTEMGSIYSFDIVAVIKDGKIYGVELSDKERQVKKMNEDIFA